jgi:ribosomal protein L24E
MLGSMLGNMEVKTEINIILTFQNKKTNKMFKKKRTNI